MDGCTFVGGTGAHTSIRDHVQNRALNKPGGHGMRLIVRINRNPGKAGHTLTERKLKTVRPQLEALVAAGRSLLALSDERSPREPRRGEAPATGRCGRR